MRRSSTYLFDARGEILHVPDRDGLICREVDHGLGHEEPVHLPLRSVLRGEELLVNDDCSGLLSGFRRAVHFGKFYI